MHVLVTQRAGRARTLFMSIIFSLMTDCTYGIDPIASYIMYSYTATPLHVASHSIIPAPVHQCDLRIRVYC
jgi:hypothetical protein